MADWNLLLHTTKSSSAPSIAQAWPHVIEGKEGSITENRTYWWYLNGDIGRPYDISLRVNGVLLSRDVSSEREIWFEWPVGFNAGFADVEILGLRAEPESVRVTVDPAQSKLVRKDFRLMLKDIMDDTRSLASTSGLHTGLTRGKRVLPIAQVEFLTESTGLLRTLVLELDSSHTKRLGRATRLVALRDARALSIAEWNRSRRHGVPIDQHVKQNLPHRVARLVAANGGLLPRRVDQTRTIPGVRQREHQEILGLIKYTIRLLRRAIRNLEYREVGQGEAVLARRCRFAARQLTGLLDLPIFANVEPIHGRWGYSHVYERVEPYRSLYRLYRDIHSGVNSVDGEFTKIPLRETFRLYETWVALRLARAAGTIDPALDASSMFRDALEQNTLTFSLTASSVVFQGSVLRFKPVYRETWQSESGLGSYSRHMIPDIVLEIQGDGMSSGQIIVLDTKYRVESELNDAVASIHMYKDALIQESGGDSSPYHRRIVTTGLIVAPSLPRGMGPETDWRKERMPTVIFRSGYQERFRLGALVLQPGADLSMVADTLERLLGRM
ncbi:nuclease domain-containing protein [Arthrobacter sp. NyZ413]|uniref:nuclease domain-containing protein n=1 Tax=Arthrobacter sp. NyZ413 TaxID=3144669 RepID=UPI003BF7FF04